MFVKKEPRQKKTHTQKKTKANSSQASSYQLEIWQNNAPFVIKEFTLDTGEIFVKKMKQYSKSSEINAPDWDAKI